MHHPFADAFAAAWARPTPEGLVALLHRNVTLIQPHRPPVHGSAEALQEFRRLFAWLPGLHGVVDRAAGDDDVVFIEWRMRLPLMHETVSIPAVDRFRLENGLGIERVVYFDQMALAAAVARHPALWPGFARYRLSR